jgi:hypothetical protein
VEQWHFLINDDVAIMIPSDDDNDQLPQTKYADEVKLDEFKIEEGTKLQFHYGEGYIHDCALRMFTFHTPNPRSIDHALLIGGEYKVPCKDDYDERKRR